MQIDFQAINCYGESLCGDSFLQEHLAENSVMVLSDGMGHGTKANVLSGLTCEIVMSEWRGLESLPTVVKTLAARLPLCSVRGIGYSTFTLLDYSHLTGELVIVEYDNPPTLLFRGPTPLIIDWDAETMESKELLCGTVKLQNGDRVVVCSDGVTQSGLGVEGMPTGWGSVALSQFVEKVITLRGDVSSSELASRIISHAVENEKYYPRDDISSMVLYV